MVGCPSLNPFAFRPSNRCALLKQDYLEKMGQAGFKVKVLSEDKEISERQYNGLALESIKIEATKP